MEKKKKTKESRIAIKIFLCLVYLVMITIVFVCSYNLFEKKEEILPWSEVKTVEDYTYIEVSKMSEKFAYNEETNIGMHFVIEVEDTGLWHTYLMAINENEYDEYKAIIDYTYERTEKKPDTIKAYGYPKVTEEDIKELAIKNIVNFVPAENEVEITKENYEEYLTNCFLDTTEEKKEVFSYTLLASLLLLFLVIVLLFLTIIDKDKIVDTLDREKERIGG